MINKGIDLTDKQLREQAELTAYIANAVFWLIRIILVTLKILKEKNQPKRK